MVSNGCETCFICGGRVEFFLRSSDFLYRTTEKEFDIYKCVSCGLEQIIPQPSEEELYHAYPDYYYSYNMIKGLGLLSKIKQVSINRIYSLDNGKFKSFLSAILDAVYFFGLPHGKKGCSRLLDIGCGDGHDVKLMKENDWEAYGFEIGPNNLKDNMFHDKSLECVDFGEMKFDWIRMWHVFEHTGNPKGYLEKIDTLLSPGGKLIIAIPNTRSAAAFLFGKYYLGRDIPRHLNGYNDKNIKTLLSQFGFEVVKIRYQSLNGVAGSLGNIINQKFSLKINWAENAIWVLLCLPIEFILRILKLSDQISIIANKKK